MIGIALLVGATIVSLAATVALWYGVVREDYAIYGRYLSGSAVVLAALALFYLATQFVFTDYTNGYVWTHTADYLTGLYRLTGLYSGVAGSLLLWATLVSVIAYWVIRSGLDTDAERMIGAVASTVATAFLAYSVTNPPFEPLSIAGRGTAFGPVGLNPLLKSPYMVIHPPITFVGYALTAVPFAIGVAHFARRVRDKEGIFEDWANQTARWLRLAWWFLTASIALGALWSYETLGWGGLWAWDPVETAVLVTWLFVTAAMHAVSNYRHRGENPILAPAMATMTLLSAVFARVITQSGTSTLHSFAAGTSLGLKIILGGTAVAGIGLPLAVWLRSGESEAEAADSLLSHSRLLYAAVLLVGLLTFVSFWGVVFPMLQQFLGGPEVSVGVDFYNMWSYPLILAVLFAIGLYNDYDLRGRASLKLLAAVVVLTAAAAVLPLSSWQFNPGASGGYYGIVGNLNALSLFPPAAYAIGATLTRLGSRLPSLSDRDRKLTLGGVGLVHIALALIVISVPFTYLFAVSASGVVPAVQDGHAGGVTLGDSSYRVTVHNYSSEHIHSELSLTDTERRLLLDKVDNLGYRAETLPSGVSDSQIVYGEITDLQRRGETGIARLDNTSVWAEIGPVRENASLAGMPIYVQGTINRSMENMTYLQTDGMFVGTDPIGAVVPDSRATHREITFEVTRGNQTIASGTTSVDFYLTQGAIPTPYIEHGLLSETYVAAKQVQFAGGMPVVALDVKVVPLMNVVRLGIVLLLLGGGLLVAARPGEESRESE